METKEIKKYDVFVSFAEEDKAFVKEFCKQLENHGLTVWCSATKLEVADNIHACVSNAFLDCRYFLPVISTHYGRRQWHKTEFHGFAHAKSDLILPILYQTTYETIKEIPMFSLILPNLMFEVTTETSNDIANRLATKIKNTSTDKLPIDKLPIIPAIENTKKIPKNTIVVDMVCLCLCIGGYFIDIPNEHVEKLEIVEKIPDTSQVYSVVSTTMVDQGQINNIATPETAPENKTAIPETTPENKTAIPETTPENKTAIPETTPENKTATPETTPENKTATPETTPENKTATPETTPENKTATPETTPENKTAIPETTHENKTATTKTTYKGKSSKIKVDNSSLELQEITSEKQEDGLYALNFFIKNNTKEPFMCTGLNIKVLRDPNPAIKSNIGHHDDHATKIRTVNSWELRIPNDHGTWTYKCLIANPEFRTEIPPNSIVNIRIVLYEQETDLSQKKIPLNSMQITIRAGIRQGEFVEVPSTYLRWLPLDEGKYELQQKNY